MLSKEENDLITRVGRGTLVGELLRRYWHPIALSRELTPGGPVKSIRLLGENLVLFRDERGELALVQESCPHRGASLRYGFVEDRGIRCPYHGWLFDRLGKCREQPFEPRADLTRIDIHIAAYRLEEKSGIIFAYMGPVNTVPLLPNWDILVREDGIKRIEIQPDLDCNWLQVQENAADVTHTYFLHSYMFQRKGIPDLSGFGRPLLEYGFQPFEWGILKSWIYGGEDGGEGWGNPLIFPNILRIETEMHWRVPIDDVTTRIFWLTFIPNGKAGERSPDDIETYIQPPRNKANGEYFLDTFSSQDAMALETQGAIFDRSREHLGASDIGIVMFRRMLKTEAEKVQRGEDPIGVIRDPAKNQFIDLRAWIGGLGAMSCARDDSSVRRNTREEVFDERHRTCVVPPRQSTPVALGGQVDSKTES